MQPSGVAAEEKAAAFLSQGGFELIDRNWRTRWCEIDIIATRDDRIYFVEVKYRAKPFWGDGIDYITKQKLRQMHFAAEFWIAAHGWAGDYCLSAISLCGPAFTVDYFVEDASLR